MSGEARLIHYSKERLGEVYSVDEQQSVHFKPKGLWLSAEAGGEDSHGWLDWCEAEEWGLERFEHASEIFLNANAKVLRVNGASELLDFNNKFNDKLHDELSYRSINWDRVASAHQGIIIAPYIWSLRLDNRVNWYYSWDCASGCIWDASAIDRVEPLSEFRKPKRREDVAAAQGLGQWGARVME